MKNCNFVLLIMKSYKSQEKARKHRKSSNTEKPSFSPPKNWDYAHLEIECQIIFCYLLSSRMTSAYCRSFQETLFQFPTHPGILLHALHDNFVFRIGYVFRFYKVWPLSTATASFTGTSSPKTCYAQVQN